MCYLSVKEIKWFNATCGYALPFTKQRSFRVCRQVMGKLRGVDAGIHVDEAMRQHQEECDPDGTAENLVSGCLVRRGRSFAPVRDGTPYW